MLKDGKPHLSKSDTTCRSIKKTCMKRFVLVLFMLRYVWQPNAESRNRKPIHNNGKPHRCWIFTWWRHVYMDAHTWFVLDYILLSHSHQHCFPDFLCATYWFTKWLPHLHSAPHFGLLHGMQCSCHTRHTSWQASTSKRTLGTRLIRSEASIAHRSSCPWSIASRARLAWRHPLPSNYNQSQFLSGTGIPYKCQSMWNRGTMWLDPDRLGK